MCQRKNKNGGVEVDIKAKEKQKQKSLNSKQEKMFKNVKQGPKPRKLDNISDPSKTGMA